MKGNRVLLVSIFVILSVLSACRQEAADEPGPGPGLAEVAVRVESVGHQAGAAFIEIPATVEAVRRATVAAKVAGTIERLPIRLGSVVEKGDLLAVISAAEMQARAAQAGARLEQVQRNLARERRLLDKDASTRETVRTLEDEERLVAAALQEARAMLGYTLIKAPFAGIVAEKRAEAGDLVMPGQPLLVLEDQTDLQVVASVPEDLAEKIALGDQFPLQMTATGVETTGTVREMAPGADATSRSRTVKLGVAPDPGLRPGQFMRLLLPAMDDAVLSVPERAVSRYGQMERIFVAEGNTARLRLVRTGRRHDGRVEVLSGLEAGEKVVTEGGELVDGQPLRVEMP